jgi:RsiW-degrading membrane proteinase PrsW (M82 family)
MSARKLLRLVLSIVVLTLLWVRISRQWRFESRWWLVGTLMLSAALLALVIYLILSSIRKPRLPRDDVPKRPLGLDG